MSFWTWLTGSQSNTAGAANTTPAESVVRPGDPNGVEFTGERALYQAFPWIQPSAWSGWPEQWQTPNYQSQQSAGLTMQKLVDVAWAAISLNASVSSSFPAYKLKNGKMQSPPTYLTNPDRLIYSSWAEFAKQLFWDYQLGEVFVLPMAMSGRYPSSFRVIPPWLMNVDMDSRNASRKYRFGSMDVTGEVLHIRNISSTADPRGHCSLEAAGARMVTAGLLEKYVKTIVETGGVPHHWLDVPGRKLEQSEAFDLLDQWVASRKRHLGGPGILSGGIDLKQAQSVSARDMTLLELAQFTEARIAIHLGVPPFLLGLPMAVGESMTYSNVNALFDHHDRTGLRPMATMVMQALSGWLLPWGSSLELNRDEYSRPGMLERAQAWDYYLKNMTVDPPFVRAAERFDVMETGASSLTGAELSGSTGNSTANNDGSEGNVGNDGSDVRTGRRPRPSTGAPPTNGRPVNQAT